MVEGGGTHKIGLMHNIVHGHLSNVKQSLYLWDETRCETRATRNVLINYNIGEMLTSKLYG
jgi:hypothetical protein